MLEMHLPEEQSDIEWLEQHLVEEADDDDNNEGANKFPKLKELEPKFFDYISRVQNEPSKAIPSSKEISEEHDFHRPCRRRAVAHARNMGMSETETDTDFKCFGGGPN